jgi:hypothetical protein
VSHIGAGDDRSSWGILTPLFRLQGTFVRLQSIPDDDSKDCACAAFDSTGMVLLRLLFLH